MLTLRADRYSTEPLPRSRLPDSQPRVNGRPARVSHPIDYSDPVGAGDRSLGYEQYDACLLGLR